MAGTGTSSTGKKLSDDLGYDFASGGSMAREVAKELDVELNVLEELSKTDSKYDILRDDRLKKFGREHENCVVEARLGWWAVPDSFKIKLVCDDKTRIGRIMVRENKTYEQVLKETIDRENSIRHRFAQYYDMDFDKETEDSKFDLTIDTAKNDLIEVLDIIKKKIL